MGHGHEERERGRRGWALLGDLQEEFENGEPEGGSLVLNVVADHKLIEGMFDAEFVGVAHGQPDLG